MTSLANRRRPATFDEVEGNGPIVKALSSLITRPENIRPRVYMFEGSPGFGKTTLARIAAGILTGSEDGIMEIDGADLNKAEDLRGIKDQIQYMTMAGGDRAIIMDECHELTKTAWNLLLKVLEEGAKYNYWFFCTSEGKKIPESIRRRGPCYALQNLKAKEMAKYLMRIAKDEGIKMPAQVRDRIVDLADGSPGKALNYLETVEPLCSADMDDEAIASALSVLRSSDQGSTDLAKALLGRASRDQVIQILKACKDAGEDAESLRRGVLGYCSAGLLGGWADKDRATDIMEVFCAGNTFDSGFPGLVLLAITAAGR